ncbi:hypothetical protein NOM72_00760 [Exiguobacterium sp. LL15]|nr:hypothetical protein [Exiguobacterium sp. LL15]
MQAPIGYLLDSEQCIIRLKSGREAVVRVTITNTIDPKTPHKPDGEQIHRMKMGQDHLIQAVFLKQVSPSHSVLSLLGSCLRHLEFFYCL